ncbi:hypothetical protein IWW36_001850 [Coemansia brasiliensis]|uniref:Pentatricopeptide repeat-containing protein-mitochondrial domain-containing protein n=1 Tax=Coemansia brasiliensis TaxID=2650707 RepID=A0A9W8I851_9FUNG|nr:hypothetical protein IWW36_001850 [Coemansia brasiliensis]
MRALLRVPWIHLGRYVMAGSCSIPRRNERLHMMASRLTNYPTTSMHPGIDLTANNSDSTAATTHIDNKVRSTTGRRQFTASQQIESLNRHAKASRYIQQHQTRLSLRNKLVQQLGCEFQEEISSLVEPEEDILVQRHILVRQLISILRRFDVIDLETNRIAGGDSMSVDSVVRPFAIVQAAWNAYSKISAHADSSSLLRQLPVSAVSLLICELNFVSDSESFHLRFEHIVQIWDDFESIDRPILSSPLFSIYLRALNMLRRHQIVLTKVDQYYVDKQGSKLPMSVMRQLIAAYFGGKQPENAMHIFNHIKSDAQLYDAITPHIYTTILRGVLQTNHLTDAEVFILADELLDLLANAKYSDNARTGILNEVLQMAAARNHSNLLYYMLEHYLARNFPINYTTFGILLRTACHQETDPRELYSLYQFIIGNESSHALLNSHIFAIFISSFLHLHRPDYAWVAFEELRAHPQAQCTIIHYKLLFSYYAEAKMPSNALSLYHLMVDNNKIQPTWKVYVDIVKAISRGTDKELFTDNMTASDDSDELLTRLVVYGSNCQADQMLDVFAQLGNRNMQTTLAFAAVVLGAYRTIATYEQLSRHEFCFESPSSRISNDEQLQTFVERLFATIVPIFLTDKGILVPEQVYRYAISAFVLARDEEKAQRVYDYMTKSKAISPTMQTFDTLLRAFVRGSTYKSAWDLFENIRSHNAPIKPVTANVLLCGLFNNNMPQQAIEVYGYLVGRPIPLLSNAKYDGFFISTPCDAYTYALLLKGLVEASLVKEAVVVFEDAFSVLPYVPRQLLATFISALEENNLVDFSLVCLRRYRKRVEESQPELLQISAANGSSQSESAPISLPQSHFGYFV